MKKESALNKNIWLPYTQMRGVGVLPEAVTAKGSRIGLRDGRFVIDAVSSWWVITLGHCHPSIVRAVQKQAGRLDQVLFANFSHRPAQQLALEMHKILPKKLSHLFFTDNGSTAVESALKMTIQSWLQRGESRRTQFISFQNSYHGDTVGAMSVSGSSLFTKPYKPILFSMVRAKQGIRSSDPVSAYVEDFEQKLRRHHASVAGVIIEPFIQGAGGMIIWPKKALSEICRISRRYGIYLIFDEVMTGFGRTGDLFAFQKLGLVPDLLCLSKGLTGGFLPLALTVVTSELYNSFLSDEKKEMFFHGHSFTGNPLSCSAALANVKEIQKPKWKREWKRIEAFHAKKIRSLRGHEAVLDVRGCGTVAAVELRLKNSGYSSCFAEEITTQALKKGVFLRPLGNILYILPPYCISNKELKQVWQVVEDSIDFVLTKKL